VDGPPTGDTDACCPHDRDGNGYANAHTHASPWRDRCCDRDGYHDRDRNGYANGGTHDGAHRDADRL
jgi:hypothetical protein